MGGNFVLLNMIFAVILAEAITNILTKSTILAPIREFLFNRRKNRVFKFLHNVLDCPYCTSVWVGVFCAYMLYLYICKQLPLILVLFFMGIVLHRLSNLLHFFVDRLDKSNSDIVLLDKEIE